MCKVAKFDIFRNNFTAYTHSKYTAKQIKEAIKKRREKCKTVMHGH